MNSDIPEAMLYTLKSRSLSSNEAKLSRCHLIGTLAINVWAVFHRTIAKRSNSINSRSIKTLARAGDLKVAPWISEFTFKATKS